MTPQQIEATLKEIQGAITEASQCNDIDSVLGKMMGLIGYLGTISGIVGTVESMYLYRQKEAINAHTNTNHSPSILKQLIESETWAERSLKTSVERTDTNLGKAIDGLRTWISQYKSEQEMSNKTKTFQT